MWVNLLRLDLQVQIEFEITNLWNKKPQFGRTNIRHYFISNNGKCWICININWRPLNLSELTPIILHMELTHFCLEASNCRLERLVYCELKLFSIKLKRKYSCLFDAVLLYYSIVLKDIAVCIFWLVTYLFMYFFLLFIKVRYFTLYG